MRYGVSLPDDFVRRARYDIAAMEILAARIEASETKDFAKGEEPRKILCALLGLQPEHLSRSRRQAKNVEAEKRRRQRVFERSLTRSNSSAEAVLATQPHAVQPA
jgi:hypothetical protein